MKALARCSLRCLSKGHRQAGELGMRRRIPLVICALAAFPAAALAQAPSPAQQAERAAYDAMPDAAGTGPYPAVTLVDPSRADHIVYRPRDLAVRGARKLGVRVWGNGGCSDDGASARQHLAEIASHGYL